MKPRFHSLRRSSLRRLRSCVEYGSPPPASVLDLNRKRIETRRAQAELARAPPNRDRVTEHPLRPRP